MFVNPFISENIIPIFFLILSFVFFNYLYNSEKFRSILRPDGKKHYGETSATSNLIKTIQCAIAVIGLIYYYITDIRYGNYPNVAMKSLTMNLLAVETLSLIKAKKYYLRKDIAYHHYGVIFFSILALGVDFNKNKPAQMLIIMLFTVSLCIPYMIYNTLKAYYNLEWLRSWAIMSYIIPFPIFVIYSIFQWRFYSSEIWKWFAIYWVPITPMLYTNYVSIKFILKRQESFTQRHGKKEY